MKNCLMGNGSHEINWDIAYHILTSTIKNQCVINTEVVIMNIFVFPERLCRREMFLIKKVSLAVR